MSPQPTKRYTRENWEPRFPMGRKYESVSPLNFKGIRASLYQTDFAQNNKLKDDVPIHKPDLWNTHRSSFPMETQTINKV